MPKKRPSYNYSSEEFTKVWNECTTVEEVSAKTGMPKPSCQSKASMLRKKGFALKMLQRGRRKTTQVLSDAQERLEKNPTTKVVDPSPIPATVDELTNGGADAA